MVRSLWLAFGLLTRLPVPPVGEPTPREVGRSPLFYPLVGVVVGGAAWATGWGAGGTGSALAAALTLTVWVVLTGGLHLDGLADSADAWVGGMGDRERTLAILKDPNAGPAGVVAVVLVLLLKFAALETLLVNGGGWVLPVAALLGRTGVLLLLATLPYARPGGMGALAAAHLPRTTAVAVGAAAVGGCAWLTMALPGPLAALATVGTTLAAWWGLRRAWRRRLGGTTGDTAGATCELLETAALVGAALTLGSAT